MRKLIFILLFPISCRSQKIDNEFILTIKLDQFKKGDSVYLTYHDPSNPNNPEVTDSKIFNEDKVIFKGILKEPVTAFLKRSYYEKVDTAIYTGLFKDMPFSKEEKEELMEFILNPVKLDIVELFLMPAEITIKSQKQMMRGKLEGPKAVLDFDSLVKADRSYLTKHSNPKEDFFARVVITKEDSIAKERSTKRIQSLLNKRLDDVYISYVRRNPNSELALTALVRGMPGNPDSADKYLELFNSLPATTRGSAAGKGLEARIRSIRNTEIGRLIDDFEQVDSLGKTVKFSSFNDKYVLLEFWASWCLPCRKKNPGLVKLYDKYSKEKFTILGIALEEKDAKGLWLKAISKDQLKWPQLTDFKGWNNAVAKQFGLNSIPFNLLVDPDGKIIGKNLYEKELDDQLAAIFKQ